MKTVAIYVSIHGGILKIVEDEFDGSKMYDAYWIPDFWINFRLLEGGACSSSLKETMAKVKTWDEHITPLEDLGEYELYFRTDTNQFLTVSLRKEHGCNTPIKAKDVPVGAYLINYAEDFFRYWKGKDAVANQRLAYQQKSVFI